MTWMVIMMMMMILAAITISKRVDSVFGRD